MPFWIAAIASALLFLAAAKTHGRQLRLEREQRGYRDVRFGTGTNPPWVEALWRRDRIRFWTTTGLLMLTATLLTIGPALLPRSGALEAGDWGLALTAALVWAPTTAFLALAILSRARLARDADTDAAIPPADPNWRRSATRGTLFWFATDALLMIGVALLAIA